MTDRYTITADKNVLQIRFSIEVTDNHQPNYNAGPSHILPVITVGSGGLSNFYWAQIPERAKNKSISQKLLYTPSEDIESKPILQETLLKRRCLVLADGFYGWKRISKKGKVAHRVIFGDNEVLGFGGLWEEFENDHGEMVHTFKIITTPANSTVSSMSAVMPVIIDRKSEKTWLDKNSGLDSLLDLLQTYPVEQMHIYSVSPKLENPDYNHPSLIEPFAPADQFGNYSLFD